MKPKYQFDPPSKYFNYIYLATLSDNDFYYAIPNSKANNLRGYPALMRLATDQKNCKRTDGTCGTWELDYCSYEDNCRAGFELLKYKQLYLEAKKLGEKYINLL